MKKPHKLNKEEVVNLIKSVFEKHGYPDFPVTIKHVQEAISNPCSTIDLIPGTGIVLYYTDLGGRPMYGEFYVARFKGSQPDFNKPGNLCEEMVHFLFIHVEKPRNMDDEYADLHIYTCNKLHIKEVVDLLNKVRSRKRLLDI